MNSDTMRSWLEVVLWMTAIPATAVPLVYGVRSMWWVTRPGKALLLSSIAVAVLVDLTLTAFLKPDLGGVTFWFWLQMIAFGFTSLVKWYLLASILTVQQTERKKP